MGLFSAIRKQLLKVIEWKDETTNTLVYRYPINETRDEIMMLDNPLEADDVLMEYLGLESDYLHDVLNF